MASAKGRTCVVESVGTCGIIVVIIAHGPKVFEGKDGKGFVFSRGLLRHLVCCVVNVLKMVFRPMWVNGERGGAEGWEGRKVGEAVGKVFEGLFGRMVDGVMRDVVGSVMHLVRSLPAPAEPEVRGEVERILGRVVGYGGRDVGWVVVVERGGGGVVGGSGRFRLRAGELEMIVGIARGCDGEGRGDGEGIYLGNGGGWRWVVRRRMVELKVQSWRFEKFIRTVGSDWRPQGGTKVEVIVVVKCLRNRKEEELEKLVGKVVDKFDCELEKKGAATEIVAAMERRWRVKDVLGDPNVKWMGIIDFDTGMMSATCEYQLSFEESCAVLRGFESFGKRLLDDCEMIWGTVCTNGHTIVGCGGFVVAVFEDVRMSVAKLIMFHFLVPWAKRFKRATIPDLDVRRSLTENINFCSCLLDKTGKWR